MVCQQHTEYIPRASPLWEPERGAPLRARASALPFWSSMPAQKGRARLLPNRHVDSRVPASLAPPAPSSRHFPPHPSITNSLLRSCGRYTRQRTWKMRQDAAEISSKHPPSTPDPRPAFHNFRSTSTEPSCPSHIRAPRTPTIAIQRRTRQIFTAGNLPRFRK